MSDEYVYCTDCYYFNVWDEHIPYCIYEDKCNINDCDDSKSKTERPYYISKNHFDTIKEILKRFSAHERLYNRMKDK